MRTYTKTAVAVFSSGLILCSVLFAGSAISETLDNYVIVGGGGRSEIGAYALQSTIGQPVSGPSTAGGSEVCSGFWCAKNKPVFPWPLFIQTIISNH